MTTTDRLPATRGDGIAVYLGDSREVLAALSPDSVDCCVTSPPYWVCRYIACVISSRDSAYSCRRPPSRLMPPHNRNLPGLTLDR